MLIIKIRIHDHVNGAGVCNFPQGSAHQMVRIIQLTMETIEWKWPSSYWQLESYNKATFSNRNTPIQSKDSSLKKNQNISVTFDFSSFPLKCSFGNTAGVRK